MALSRKIATAAALALTLFAGASQAADKLVIGTDSTYPPFEYLDAGGQFLGFDMDIGRALCAQMKVECTFVSQEWDGIIPALQAKKFDMILSSMSITDERLKKMDFSIPYRVSIGRFVGAKDKQLKLFDSDGKPIPENFDGLTIGVERSTTYSKWIEAKLPGAQIQLYDSGQAMLLDLRSGRVDVAITNPMKAYLEFLSKDEGKTFDFVSPPIDEKAYFGTGVGIGIRKGQDELVHKVDAALKTLIDNGSLDAYGRKYFPFSISPDKWNNASTGQ